MLFNIEFDAGDSIEGYVIPDGFSEQPSILVSDHGGPVARVACDQLREAVIGSGRHGSGMVGFRLDATVIPGLAEMETLAIHDAKTGLLIYRRVAIHNRKNLKIVRLETHMIPSLRLDRYCSEGFQFELFSAERFGHETTLQAFHLQALESVFISGRLLMKNYEVFLDRGFRAVALLTDPFYEMAGRLFLLKKMSTSPVPFLGDRDRLILAPAVEHFAEVALTSTSSLKTALKKAPTKVRDVLSSPLTRQLVCTSPEQSTARADIAAAVDLLSRFTVVGHDNDLAHYQHALAELFERPVDQLPLPPRHMALQELANKLRELPVAEGLIEHDLILDHYVRQALRVNTH
ncbi:hypothetical protein [Ensifer sp. SL37]|uniref:hypothetical protein n=1 Tax=Ensifer sp. SL37 TaxID=2995137 RepID=UPI002276A353|nr:hypothetical protein [Ensifer sp. SL37]MCY1740357.1 hypothetical protein [Ensifer sp. SL37]